MNNSSDNEEKKKKFPAEKREADIPIEKKDDSDGASKLPSPTESNVPLTSKEEKVVDGNKKAMPKSAKKKSKKNVKENKTLETVLTVVLVVVAIVLIIVTVGWLFSKLNKTDYEDAVIVEEEDELEAKKKKLKTIEVKIAPLELIKNQIERTEKRYLIWARMVIGFFMVCLNLWFAYYYINFDGTFELNKILSFNSAILLCYSFIAFLLYGTPGNFVAALKNTITNYLKKEHIHTLTELEKLMEERNMLVKDIEALEKIRNQK